MILAVSAEGSVTSREAIRPSRGSHNGRPFASPWGRSPTVSVVVLRRVGLVVAALGLVAACSGSDGAPVTTNPEVGSPSRSTAPPPRSGEPLRDGTSPAYIHFVDVPGRTITVDVIQVLTGDEADRAYEARTGDAGRVPNDYFIVNQSPRLRTLPVADDVVVSLVRLSEDQSPDSDPGTFAELPRWVGRGANHFRITVEDGTVTAIDEQYTP
jgi:hypothetical protein